jgi:subtilisin family serine protease
VKTSPLSKSLVDSFIWAITNHWVLSFLIPLTALQPKLCFSDGEPEFVTGEVLVQYHSGASQSQIDKVEATHSLQLLGVIKSIGVHQYRISSVMVVDETIELLNAEPIVQLVEPNYISKTESFTMPTDPGFKNLWYLENTGQIVNGIQGEEGFDIDWLEAMEVYDPKELVVVAVLDSGTAYYHPEFWSLSGSWTTLWLNYPELNGIDYYDDDNNGYIDDIWGYDFFDNDTVPVDENGHGTLCASIIAGIHNNAIKGIGISPDVEIMTLRVGNDLGQVSSFAWMSAMEYAADNGAKILNCSFGGPSYSWFGQETIREMEDRGILVVCAAGNNGTNNDDLPQYPANYLGSNVLSVASVDPKGNLSYFSNYGVRTVDIAAPGSSIFGAAVSRSPHYFQNFDGYVGDWATYPLADNYSSFEYWDLFEYEPGNMALSDSVDSFGELAYYEGWTHTVAQSPLINLSGLMGPLLKFDIVFQLEAQWFIFDTDLLFVEASLDETNWRVIDTIYGAGASGQIRAEQVDLSYYENQSIYIRFRLKTDLYANYLGVLIDNFEISFVKAFDYSGNEHQFSDGTSFAAPIVSGVAALALAQRPELKAFDLKLLTLFSAYMDPHESLEGRLRTEGMVNAHNAIALSEIYSMATIRMYYDSEPITESYDIHPWLEYVAFQNPIGFNDWIYQYPLEWLYTVYDTEESVYFYSPFDGWFWMHKDIVPIFYSLDEREWYYWINWTYAD